MKNRLFNCYFFILNSILLLYFISCAQHFTKIAIFGYIEAYYKQKHNKFIFKVIIIISVEIQA